MFELRPIHTYIHTRIYYIFYAECIDTEENECNLMRTHFCKQDDLSNSDDGGGGDIVPIAAGAAAGAVFLLLVAFLLVRPVVFLDEVSHFKDPAFGPFSLDYQRYSQQFRSLTEHNTLVQTTPSPPSNPGSTVGAPRRSAPRKKSSVLLRGGERRSSRQSRQK